MALPPCLPVLGPAAITISVISAILSFCYFRQDYMLAVMLKILNHNFLTLICCALAAVIFVFGLLMYWGLQAIFGNSQAYMNAFYPGIKCGSLEKDKKESCSRSTSRENVHTTSSDQERTQRRSSSGSSSQARRLLKAMVRDHVAVTDGESSAGES